MQHVFDWHYLPARGRFAVQVMSEAHTETLFFGGYPTLDSAVRTWARQSLPVRSMVASVISDEDDIVVLSYHCLHDPMRSLWWGTGAAFESLDRQQIGSAVDRAMWETMAKDCMGVPT